jgi:hypothetical protein
MKKLSILLVVTGVIASIARPALSATSKSEIFDDIGMDTRINTIKSSNSININLSDQMIEIGNQKSKEKKEYIKARIAKRIALFKAIF